MTFNKEILKLLQEVKVDVDHGLLYLLAVYCNLDVEIFPHRLRSIINMLGIFVINDMQETVEWKIPLFKEGEEPEQKQENDLNDPWQWIESEYIPMFKAANPSKHKTTLDTIKRMQGFFKEHKDVTKEEVLNAVKLHINETDSRYIKQSNYFIKKGKDESFLYDYIMRVRELKDKSENKVQNKFKLQ